jgi:hypothetical protein
MGGVQEPLFDKTLLWGQGSPKFQYSARGPLTTHELRKKYEKNMWETELQPAEKTTSCDKRYSWETTTTLLALAYQKLGYSQGKYHAGTTLRQSSGVNLHLVGPRQPARECRRMNNFRIAGDLTGDAICTPEVPIMTSGKPIGTDVDCSWNETRAYHGILRDYVRFV